jgi:hypothetical protein
MATVITSRPAIIPRRISSPTWAIEAEECRANPSPLNLSSPSPFHWLFRWQSLRRLLVAFALLATVTAIFYTVENWRGNRAWENAKRALEAKGEVLDWSTYIPPTVPDEQNLFDAPKMQEWFVRSWPKDIRPNSFSVRLTNAASATVGDAHNVITNATAARAYVEWSDTLASEFNLIRHALQRPYARMYGDYQRPFEMPLPNFVVMRSLAQTLAQRAHCELLLGRPESALNDLTLLHDLRYFLEGKPADRPMTLVAAMIRVALTELYVYEISWGLKSGAWQEPQWTALQKQLEETHLLTSIVDSLRSERAAVCHTFEHARPGDVAGLLSFNQPEGGFFKNHSDPLYLLFAYAPRGWVKQNLARFALLEQEMIQVLDSSNGLVRPAENDQAMRHLQAPIQNPAPFTLLARIAIPNFTRALQTAARNQTLVNQGAIACALERYKFANGQYPETLGALVPRFIREAPRDIIGGQPLKYRHTDDGRFLLYSVGWDETDDGGAHSDWVWSASRN